MLALKEVERCWDTHEALAEYFAQDLHTAIDRIVRGEVQGVQAQIERLFRGLLHSVPLEWAFETSKLVEYPYQHQICG